MARYALLVGISDYQSPLRHLSKTATDDQAVSQVLKPSDLFQKITLLKGTVTGNQFSQSLQQLLRQQKPHNRTLIYTTGAKLNLKFLLKRTSRLKQSRQ